jgi:pimeloyl-ACP methyl ester carboxylesterase
MARLRILLQSFIPWCLFFALNTYGSMELKIAIVAAIIAILVLNFKALRHRLLFDWGSLLFFIMLGIFVIGFNKTWFILNALFVANLALMAIVWISVIIKKPITSQYTKLAVAKELWTTTIFYRTNNYVTICWGLILTTIAIVSYVQQLVWGGQLWLSELIPTGLILLGIWFTFWFPEWYKRNIIGEWGVLNIRNISDLTILSGLYANIAFRTIGKGPKLFLLPSSHMNMYAWAPELISKLSKHYQVFIFDYPDIGRSKLNRGDFTITNLGKAITEFIKNTTKPDEKVTIVGYSMGGWLAQELAINHYEVVKKLILISTDVGSPRSARADSKILNFLTNASGGFHKGSEKALYLLFPKASISALAPKMNAIFTAANFNNDISNTVIQLENQLINDWYQGPGTYKQLHKIDVPTLVLSGAKDKVINRQNIMLLVNGIPGAQFVEFSDAGHGVIYQYPTRIAEEIMRL